MLDPELKKYIANKTIKLDENLVISFEDIYNRKKFDYVKYFPFSSSILIMYKYKSSFIFFNKLIPIEVNKKYKNESQNTKSTFLYCSTYEISEYCKKENINPYIIINDYKYKFMDILNFEKIKDLMSFNKIELTQEYYEYDSYVQGTINLSFPIKESELKVKPDELSKYFNLFFKFESNNEFEYWYTKKRQVLNLFILYFSRENEEYIFKMCGPSGIGKSITLFFFSRCYGDYIYFNLKTIKLLKKDDNNAQIHNIINEAFKYLFLKKEHINEFEKITKKTYLLSFFSCLKEIIDFLIKQKVNCVIIFDQFKSDAIEKDEYENILLSIKNQEEKIVKLLICSSTNDGEIRTECIRSWKNKIFELKNYNKETQEFYFYIDELYDNIKKDDSYYSKVLNEFNFIPKYRKIFSYLKPKERKIKEEKKDDKNQEEKENDKNREENEEDEIQEENEEEELEEENEEDEIQEENEENDIQEEKEENKTKEKKKKSKFERVKDDLEDIKKRVKNNLSKLYNIIVGSRNSDKIINMKMIESLRYLSLNLDKKLKYEQLEEIMEICSFKYYKFKFTIDYFSILYNFPYMREIVNDIIDKHLEEFYQYKLNEKHSGSANSNFFELFSGKSIKEGILKLPCSLNAISIEVDEIVKMKQFINSKTDIITKIGIDSNLKEYIVQKKIYENKSEENKEFGEKDLLLSLKEYIDYDVTDIEFHKWNYLNNLKNNYTIKGDENLGNMSIFIHQKNQRGQALDFAYVYGDKNNKTFIGFQMKAYDKSSSHDISFNETRESLKKTLESMLINIEYLMGMKIKSWHYVIIILYEKQKPVGKQYYDKLIDICKRNGFEYLFYEPFENSFYDRNIRKIDQFKPTKYSNLDNNIENILPINIMIDNNINKYTENFLNYIEKNKMNNTSFIADGLNSFLSLKTKRPEYSSSKSKINTEQIKNVLETIILKIKNELNIDSIKFVSAYEHLNLMNIPEPQPNYFFLFEENKKGKYILILQKENLCFEYYQCDLNSILNENKKENLFCNYNPSEIIPNINRAKKFYVFKFKKKITIDVEEGKQQVKKTKTKSKTKLKKINQ